MRPRGAVALLWMACASAHATLPGGVARAFADAGIPLSGVSVVVRESGQPQPLFTHDPDANGGLAGRRLREGRQLVADLRCTKCHAAPATPAGMPELSADAPALTNVANRLNADWVAAWVADPKSFRKDAHMPRVLRDAAASKDVAAYLATLGIDAEWRAIDPTLAPAGGQLFASLNCAACHLAPDARWCFGATGARRIPVTISTASSSNAAPSTSCSTTCRSPSPAGCILGIQTATSGNAPGPIARRNCRRTSTSVWTSATRTNPTAERCTSSGGGSLLDEIGERLRIEASNGSPHRRAARDRAPGARGPMGS